MVEKKDILEFPLEELEIPPAIKLMMQAALATGIEMEKGAEQTERLLQLSEKLEVRVEDAIDAAKSVRDEPVEEDEPNKFEDAEPSDTQLVIENGEVYRVVHKGVIFAKLCNVRVSVFDDYQTTCIKEWGHEGYSHEDRFGGVR